MISREQRYSAYGNKSRDQEYEQYGDHPTLKAAQEALEPVRRANGYGSVVDNMTGKQVAFLNGTTWELTE